MEIVDVKKIDKKIGYKGIQFKEKIYLEFDNVHIDLGNKLILTDCGAFYNEEDWNTISDTSKLDIFVKMNSKQLKLIKYLKPELFENS